MPNRSRRYALPWTDFPPSFQIDAEAYLNRLGNPDPLADDYAEPLRPATIEGRRGQILQLATAIVRAGVPPKRITDLAVLVEPDNAKLALRFFLDRKNGQRTETIHQYAICSAASPGSAPSGVIRLATCWMSSAGTSPSSGTA